MIEIKNRFTGQVICTGETIADAVQKNLAGLRGADLRLAGFRGADLSWADLSGADLSGAGFRGADLSWADLSGADLRGAGFRGADLRLAGLRGADLRGADFSGADLRGAGLSGAKLAWQSHDLLAEILRRAAGYDIAKLKIAGFILLCRHKCWREFLSLTDREPLSGWAMGVLAEWVQDKDGAPDAIRKIALAKTE